MADGVCCIFTSEWSFHDLGLHGRIFDFTVPRKVPSLIAFTGPSKRLATVYRLCIRGICSRIGGALLRSHSPAEKRQALLVSLLYDLWSLEIIGFFAFAPCHTSTFRAVGFCIWMARDIVKYGVFVRKNKKLVTILNLTTV